MPFPKNKEELKQRLLEEEKNPLAEKYYRLFCGDCKRFRTWRCNRVWSIGMHAKRNDGHFHCLHNPTDIVPWFCEDEKLYEEIEYPVHRLEQEERLYRNSRKYGGKIVWSTSMD